MNRTQRRLAVALSCLTLFGVGVGCTTHAPAVEQRTAVRSIADTYDAMGTTMIQLEGVRSALDRASDAPDLRAWYTEFSRKVDDVQRAGERARADWLDMKKDANQYILAWQEEAARIEDDQLRETMDQRRQRVAEGYSHISDMAMELRERYRPFLENLKELDRALALDLTPSGIKAMQPSIDKTKADAEQIARRLNDLGTELDKLRGRMKTTEQTASRR